MASRVSASEAQSFSGVHKALSNLENSAPEDGLALTPRMSECKKLELLPFAVEHSGLTAVAMRTSDSENHTS
jgi:hypothetical protein